MPIIPGCCILRPGPGPCGRPSVYRYETMAGGWAYCCAEHGAIYASIAERLVDGVWQPAPERLYTSLEEARQARLEQGRQIRAWLADRGHDAAWLARETGYAIGTVRTWLSGQAPSRPALAKLQALGILSRAQRRRGA